MTPDTSDKYDQMAEVAGTAAGLRPEQWPGFAHILRELAKEERAAKAEECARVADDVAKRLHDVYEADGACGAKDAAAAIRARG